MEALLDEHRNVTLAHPADVFVVANQVELWFSKVQRGVLSRGHLHVDVRAASGSARLVG